MKGETIKEILRIRNISSAEIARRLGMSPQTLSAALSNDDIRTGLMEKIAEHIGVSPASFYTGDHSATAVATGTQSTATANVQNDAGVAALAKQLDVKDGQIRIKDEQIDRLLGLLERA